MKEKRVTRTVRLPEFLAERITDHAGVAGSENGAIVGLIIDGLIAEMDLAHATPDEIALVQQHAYGGRDIGAIYQWAHQQSEKRRAGCQNPAHPLCGSVSATR